jgi:hypothetical protein
MMFPNGMGFEVPAIMRASLALALILTLLSATAAAELLPVHTTLKSSRAQQNREQIFRYLMNGKRPSWMKGRSVRQVKVWGERMRGALMKQGRSIVRTIAANPTADPSLREQRILGLLSPQQRAQLLKEEAGFRVEKVKYRVDGKPTDKLKVVIRRHGFNSSYNWRDRPPQRYTDEMAVYNRVMGPNLITFMPAGGHSKYMSKGHVTDLWSRNGYDEYGVLRPNKRPLFPTWLSDGEAKRMKTLFDVGASRWDQALGKIVAYGRPGMWPPKRGQTKPTGNSCTTTFNRAPVGERSPRYAWIDALQDKVQATAQRKQIKVGVAGVNLRKERLLAAVSGKSEAQVHKVFAALRPRLRGKARIDLDRLERQVDFLHQRTGSSEGGTRACAFPMDLMHRAPLSQLAKIKGDPVGPGMATQKFRAGEATRLGVVTVFERE